MAGIYSSSEKCKPLRPSQILISEKLVAEVIRFLEEKYINPFSVLVAEDCLFNLISGIPINDQLAAMKFATETFMVNGKKKFHEVLPKTRFAAFKIYESGEKQQAAHHGG